MTDFASPPPLLFPPFITTVSFCLQFVSVSERTLERAHSTFTALLNLGWAYVAWKYMGYTEQAKESSWKEMWRAYKQSISVQTVVQPQSKETEETAAEPFAALF